MFDAMNSLEDDLLFVPGEFFKDESVEAQEISETQVQALLTSESSAPTTLNDVKKHMFQYARTNQWGRVESTWKAAFEGETSSESKPVGSVLKPDFETCEWLIRSYAERIGKSQDAEALFEKMKQMRSGSSGESSTKAKASTKPLPMTAMAYTSLMLALARDGRTSKMFEVFTEMKSAEGLIWKDTDVRRVSQALHPSHLKAADFVQAVMPCIEAWSSGIKQSKKKGYNLSISNLAHALKLEVSGYAVAKSLAQHDLASASHYASEIIDDPNAMIFTKTTWHVAHWYIYKNQFTEARNFINQAALRDKPSRSQGHTKMGSYLAPRLAILMLELPLLEAKNKTKTAEALLPQFYALFDSYANYDAHAVAQFMVKTLYQFRLYDDLFKVVAYVDRAIGSSISLTSIFNLKLRAHVALDQPEEALKMLSRMQAEPLHAPNPQTSTYLISMAARLHGAQAAHDLLKSIIEAVGIPHGTAFKAVVEAYCRESRVEEALQVLDLMDSKGLKVIWDDYEPVMELYERMNLLGKQFSLFNWLLTKRLAHQPPSPSLTANLILSSIRQQYVNVARSVAKGVEIHHIPLSTALVSALLVLHNVTKNTEALTKLALFCESKTSSNGGESTNQRSRYGALAIRAYTFLDDFVKAHSVYDELKGAHLHQNIAVLNALLESNLFGKKVRDARELLTSPGALELEFGPAVVQRAKSHPHTIALRFRLFPKNVENYTEMKAKWDEIVKAEFDRRAQAEKSKLATTTPAATSTEHGIPKDADSTEHAMATDDAEQAALGTPDMVTESNLVNLDPEIQVAAASEEASEAKDAKEMIENEDALGRSRGPRPPRPSLYVALELLREAYKKIESKPEDALKVIQDIRRLDLPPTMNQHVIHAKVLIRNGSYYSLQALLKRIFAAHFNMSRAFYLALFRDISKIRKSREVRHRLAMTVLGWMERVKGDRSPAPNAEIWNAFFVCVSPSEVGYMLEKYTKEAGQTITTETMDSLTRMMIMNTAPLHVAVHDVFVLFADFEARYGIYPSVQALTTLFSACMRSIVPNIYKQKFFLTLKALNGPSADKCKLTWSTSDLAYVKKEAESIVTGQQKYRKAFNKSQMNFNMSNTHEARAQLIDALLKMEFPVHPDAPTPLRGQEIATTIPSELDTPFAPITLALTTTPLPKRNTPQNKQREEEYDEQEEHDYDAHEFDEARQKRLQLIKRLRVMRQTRDPRTAALLSKALNKFGSHL